MSPLIAVRCQVIEGIKEQVEDMKTSSISLDILIQIALMNTPKKETLS